MVAKSTTTRLRRLCWLSPLFGLVACAAPAVKDYQKFYDQTPFTVVVPPVVNRTSDVEAPRYFTATITKPLVDRGYYVLPVEATAAILRAEGVVDGEMLLATDPSKFRDIFGADAVMFVTLLAWDTTYLVVHSSVTVTLGYKLVSTRSGETLWETQSTQTVDEGVSGTHPIALGIGLLRALVSAVGTDYVPMAMTANGVACTTLPSGPYAADFAKEKAQYLRTAKPKNGQSKAP